MHSSSSHSDVRFGLFFLLLSNAKSILLEEELSSYLTHSCEDYAVHAFSEGICPKAYVIA